MTSNDRSSALGAAATGTLRRMDALTILLVALLGAPPAGTPLVGASPVARAPGVAVMGQCDPKGDGKKPRWPKALRRETYARVRHACEALGASDVVCAYMDLIVERESHGRAGVRHHRGRNENGLGAMGLSLDWQSHRWPGKDEDPAWCQPENSVTVVQALLFRAFDHYNARTISGFQSIYGGSWQCFAQGRRRKCVPGRTHRSYGHLCTEMRERGFSCRDKVTRADLGRRLKRSERREFASQVASDYPLFAAAQP